MPPELCAAGWRRLPSGADQQRLIAAARAAYGVPDAAAIVPAPGTQALIQWLPRLAPPGEVAIVGPTYSEHRLSWSAAGRAVQEIADLAGTAGIARHRVLVNPNNPDGRVVARSALIEAAAAAQRRAGWLIVDEAFADPDPGTSAIALCAALPVVVLRSFGKFYGLPGLRLGFAIAPPDIARGIAAALGPWPVSGPALAVGGAALADRAWAQASRGRLAAAAECLDRLFASFGLAVVGGTALFRLVRQHGAAGLHDALARQHIWTRRFDWAPDLLRVGLPPDPAGSERLRMALRHALGHD